jgi:anaerobic selenocysteine-containing dehydrogenase
MTPSTERIQGYCALCVSRCGSIAVVEDGRFIALEPDPSHPTGRALCAKGRAAPELVYHDERLRYPMKRTRPKGDPDPGWERIGWDEALDSTADRLRTIADESGPESVVVSLVSPSTSASDDSWDWVHRLAYAFGTPNICGSMELCGWGRYFATLYTFGTSVPGVYMPDLESAGCILYWGYNPNLARLSHATATMDALKRGAKLIVVDPRRVGPATRADHWLPVRPGTDAALALGLANVLLERGWYDQDFVRDWTNGPFLVGDDGHLLTERDLDLQGSPSSYLTWSPEAGGPVALDPERQSATDAGAALRGSHPVETLRGPVPCRTVFDCLVETCSAYRPDAVEDICGVPAADVVAAAELLWHARPVAYYAWSGVEMQTGSTQIARAIAQLSILTGSFDVPGGNVRFGNVPTNDVAGQDLLPAEQAGKTLGRAERPLGPARFGYVTTDELYRGILEGDPYKVRGLVGFGANLLLAHADPRRGREALRKLDFYVHADLFMNPTAQCADIVLPVASAFEREGLRVGFEISAEAQQHVQLRPKVVEPRGEARSDNRIIFDLAVRLGFGEHFWNGDEDAANDALLAPSGLTVEQLRAAPGGVRVPVPTRHRTYADDVAGGGVRGFGTPSRRIELYSEELLEHGYPPLPTFEEPLVGPRSRPDLAARYPLVLTCAKHTLYCETQHRSLPSLRRKAPEPEVELNPETAGARGIEEGDWVIIETPEARVRARARLVASLRPDVVSGQHGWWQACEPLGAEAFDAFDESGANYNLLIGNDAIDPVSGSVPHRAYLCEVRPTRAPRDAVSAPS